jgi:hypothetical protein
LRLVARYPLRVFSYLFALGFGFRLGKPRLHHAALDDLGTENLHCRFIYRVGGLSVGGISVWTCGYSFYGILAFLEIGVWGRRRVHIW